MRGRLVLSIFITVLLAWEGAVPAYAAPAKRFVPPVEGQVTKPYDMQANPYAAGSHRGIDYGVPSGTTVKASEAGRVIQAGPVADDGLFVTIEHSGGLRTMYSYLSKIDVSEGQEVSQGTPIGLSGDGHPGSASPALHFGAKRDDKYIDPETLFLDYADIRELIELEQQDTAPPNRGFAPASVGDSGGLGGTGKDNEIPRANVTNLTHQPTSFSPSKPGRTILKGSQPTRAGPLNSTLQDQHETNQAQSPGPRTSFKEIPNWDDPARTRVRWDGLTAEEKKWQVENNSKQIGRLDGRGWCPFGRNEDNGCRGKGGVQKAVGVTGGLLAKTGVARY